MDEKSVRVRLTEAEVKLLLHDGEVYSRCEFVPGAGLRFGVRLGDTPSLRCLGGPGELFLVAPRAAVTELLEKPPAMDLGLVADQETSGGRWLRIALEVDLFSPKPKGSRGG